MSHDEMSCNHDWSILTNDKRDGPGVSTCTKCGLWLHHSNRLQLEMNRHVFGFQKWMSALAIVISAIALGISIAVAILK